MRLLNFIENVDWNKNIFYLIIYVSIIVLCVFLYLLPMIDNYKSFIMEYRKTSVLDSQIESMLAILKAEQEKFSQNNIETFNRLTKSVDSTDIVAFIGNYIKEINMKDLGIAKTQNDIKIHYFKITGKSQNLEKIKHLIADISTLPNIVRIAFPLIIYKKGNTFFIEMNLQIYNAESNADFAK